MDYIKMTWQMKRAIVNFAGQVCKGIFRPQMKLITDMLYGVSKSKSCMLSEITRALGEPIKEKKTIERLSRGLSTFKSMDTLLDNYTQMSSKYLGDDPVFAIDGSDLGKPGAKHMQYATQVWDGSKGETVNGYSTIQISALSDECKVPMPVYDRVYSSIEPTFVSANEETLKGLRHLSRHFAGRGVRVLDRGYDAEVFIRYFLEKRERFVIRLTNSRHVIHNGNRLYPDDLAQNFKGRYAFTFHGRENKAIPCKLSSVPIELPDFPGARFRVVYIYGLGNKPMMLLSNMQGDDKALALMVAKVYMLRWRIEEHFRCQKVQYDFEGFRIRSLAAIRTLHRILAILMLFIGISSEKRASSTFTQRLIVCSRRIFSPRKGKENRKYLNYAIIDAIAHLLRLSASGIRSLIPPRRPPPVAQVNFFHALPFCSSLGGW